MGFRRGRALSAQHRARWVASSTSVLEFSSGFQDSRFAYVLGIFRGVSHLPREVPHLVSYLRLIT